MLMFHCLNYYSTHILKFCEDGAIASTPNSFLKSNFLKLSFKLTAPLHNMSLCFTSTGDAVFMGWTDLATLPQTLLSWLSSRLKPTRHLI